MKTIQALIRPLTIIVDFLERAYALPVVPAEFQFGGGV